MPAAPHALARLLMRLLLCALSGPAVLQAADVQVALAANFAAPMERIAASFARDTGHRAIPIVGATGKLYAQIKNGAPFDILLSADDETPRKLEREGDGVTGSRFTYARGTLALWSAQPGFVDAQAAVLRNPDIKRLALANPKLAPYGQAAVETLKALGLHDGLQAKFVMGENIAQTHQFIATGNAELGFVALSQVIVPGKPVAGSQWIVPATLHAPILQDAVLLKRAADNPAAQAFMKYLRSEAARVIIRTYGYTP